MAGSELARLEAALRGPYPIFNYRSTGQADLVKFYRMVCEVDGTRLPDMVALATEIITRDGLRLRPYRVRRASNYRTLCGSVKTSICRWLKQEKE